jgi:hypothetical protein
MQQDQRKSGRANSEEELTHHSRNDQGCERMITMCSAVELNSSSVKFYVIMLL